MIVFAGSSHPGLAGAICTHLGIRPGALRTVRFSNENIKVKVDQNVRDQDVFVVQTSAPPVSDHVLELLILLDALKGASAKRVTVALPYYPYVRSDKKDEPRISITARLIADLLAAAGADRIIVMDLHSPQTQGFFRIPADQVTAVPVLARAVKEAVPTGSLVVVAPDAGAAKLAERYARLLGTDLAILEKQRHGDDERAVAVRIVGEVGGRDALIVDDEVSTGGTLVEATDFLLGKGAKSVRAAIVHGVLCGPALERLTKSALVELFTTDSVPARAHPKLRVLSVAPLLGDTIRRIHEGRSVAELWD